MRDLRLNCISATYGIAGRTSKHFRFGATSSPENEPWESELAISEKRKHLSVQSDITTGVRNWFYTEVFSV